MSGGLHDWDKFHRSIKGYNGKSSSPTFKKIETLPSKKQLDYIELLINALESNGVEVSWMEQITSGAYKQSAEVCYKLTAQLVFLRRKHGIPSGTHVTYTNLCKEKSTGKKIKYKTHRRFAVPVGYELIGELSKEVVILETA